MTDERKATDVLLAIEAHLLTLTKSMATYDLMSKLTLDKVNKIYAYINKLELEVAEEQKMQQATFQQEKSVQEQMPMQVEENPIGTRRTSRVELPQQQINTLVRQDMTQANIDNKKVPIIQRITDNNGKDLFMAEVSIMNERKEVVLKTKTNAVGKWQAHIKPGKYIVHVSKTDGATKNKIEAMQDINVPNIDSTFTLPVAIIKRA